MDISKKIKDLCPPAMFYFAISMIGLILMGLHNLGNTNVYKLGSYSANVPSTVLVFIVKLIYILFWTWILNLICKDGYNSVSWFLVLVPFILSFVSIGVVMVNHS
jgi:hypothetical protein